MLSPNVTGSWRKPPARWVLLTILALLTGCGQIQVTSNSGAIPSGGSGSSGSSPITTPPPTVGTAPTLSDQPQGVQATVGQTASFTVTAAGDAPLSYQWKKNDVVIAGAVSSSYTTAPLQFSDSGTKYSVVVYNKVGAIVSSEALVTVTAMTVTAVAASIITQPVSQAVAIGASATFTVVASGTMPLSYQWFRNGVAVSGAIASTLTITAAAPSDSGSSYSVVVSNPANTPVTSSSAALDVLHTLNLLAGELGGIGDADATGAAASFDNPVAVATDTSGNIYVIDQSSQLIRKITAAGVVTTIAGTAAVAGSADGPCATATFNNPSGIAVDTAGNIYIADTDNNTIRKVTMPGCVVSTLAGTPTVQGYADGPGASALFAQPQGIALDAAGNVYVADTGTDTIRKISAGIVSTLAGTDSNVGSADGTGPAASFSLPTALAVDSTGNNIYVADYLNSTIRRITAAGVVTTLAGTPGNFGAADGTGAAASFNGPTAVTLDAAASTLYVADPENGTVRKLVIASGTVTTFAGTTGTTGWLDATGSAAQFAFPIGIATDSHGNLFVADSDNNMIRMVTTPGAVVTTLAGSIGGRGYADATGNAARFNDPHNIVSDSQGSLYVADSGNNVIRKITAGGIVTTFVGTQGITGSIDGTGSAAQFDQPFGMVFDSHGNLYVADSLNSTIRMITPAGVVTTFAGTAGVSGTADGTGTAARFNTPYSLSIDASDTLYLADYGNNTIRKITTPGAVVSTLAGTAGVAGYADGAGTAAQFSGPHGVAVNLTTGNIYVADRFNEAIRMITPAGAVTTIAGSPTATDYADGTGSAAHFHWPAAIAVDQGTGNLYVCDYLHNEIREIASGNVVTTVVGAPNTVSAALGPLPAALSGPSSLTIVAGAPALQFAVADSLENSILIATLP